MVGMQLTAEPRPKIEPTLAAFFLDFNREVKPPFPPRRDAHGTDKALAPWTAPPWPKNRIRPKARHSLLPPLIASPSRVTSGTPFSPRRTHMESTRHLVRGPPLYGPK
jgi:hypothetical protein